MAITREPDVFNQAPFAFVRSTNLTVALQTCDQKTRVGTRRSGGEGMALFLLTPSCCSFTFREETRASVGKAPGSSTNLEVPRWWRHLRRTEQWPIHSVAKTLLLICDGSSDFSSKPLQQPAILPVHDLRNCRLCVSLINQLISGTRLYPDKA